MDKSNPLFKAATWTPHVVCPACGYNRVTTSRTMPKEAETLARVRYHKCRKCLAMFKSVEEVKACG